MGKQGKSSKQSNNDRSNTLNPNNGANKAANDNKSNQHNPNHAASKGSKSK